MIKKSIKIIFGSLVMFAFFMIGNYALATYYSNDFTASTINEGFPIPSEAELVKEEVELEKYRWDIASDRKRLPFS